MAFAADTTVDRLIEKTAQRVSSSNPSTAASDRDYDEEAQQRLLDFDDREEPRAHDVPRLQGTGTNRSSLEPRNLFFFMFAMAVLAIVLVVGWGLAGGFKQDTPQRSVSPQAELDPRRRPRIERAAFGYGFAG